MGLEIKAPEALWFLLNAKIYGVGNQSARGALVSTDFGFQNRWGWKSKRPRRFGFY
jgi:hypothetical protein